ncbi:MAG: DsbA family protein [Bacteroidota bacterium]|nr:DsbA family protein [Bacteroidota bacterium]
MKYTFSNVFTTVLVVCAVTITAILLRREFFSPDDLTEPSPSPIRQLDVDAWRQASENGIILGSSTAKVKIVEFYDYECSFCSRVRPTLDEIRQKYPAEVAIVHRHFPLSFHTTAYQSAVAAECAHSQGRFEVYHKALFEQQGLSASLDWIGLARVVGMPDLPRFRECVEQRVPSEKIDDDIQLGESLAITAIPTLIVERKLFQGVLTTTELDEIVRRAIQDSE